MQSLKFKLSLLWNYRNVQWAPTRMRKVLMTCFANHACLKCCHNEHISPMFVVCCHSFSYLHFYVLSLELMYFEHVLVLVQFWNCNFRAWRASIQKFLCFQLASRSFLLRSERCTLFVCFLYFLSKRYQSTTKNRFPLMCNYFWPILSHFQMVLSKSIDWVTYH